MRARTGEVVRTEDFDYELPSRLIAQQPVEPRDSSRLMVVDRSSGQIDHRVFSDIVEYMCEGDVLVINDTRVLPARLRGEKQETGGEVEVLLVRERYTDTWECLVKPGRRLKPGAHMVFGDGALTGMVVDTLDDLGGRVVQFHPADGDFLETVHRLGETPLPPYIVETLADPERYQTVYAREERSVAAPTSGLHFTEELLSGLERAGVVVARLDLDVGIDTFRPVSEEDPADHVMHSERFRVPSGTADTVNEARREGRRVTAVGTTSVRALESAFEGGLVQPSTGPTDLFILPGHRFQAVDSMVTNFHLPRTTMLMMVAAFAGRDLIARVYETAVEEGYRFLSFGDAMMLL